MYSIRSVTGYWLSIYDNEIYLKSFDEREMCGTKAAAERMILRAFEKGYDQKMFTIYKIERI